MALVNYVRYYPVVAWKHDRGPIVLRNEYRERWSQWLPSVLEALAKDPPDFPAVMPLMPLPVTSPPTLVTPPRDLRVSIISSSGAFDRRTQAPYIASSLIGDPTHRVFAVDVPSHVVDFAHEHFDQTAAIADMETIIPRRALVSMGVTLTQHIISWSGYLLDWPTFIEATVPQIVKQAQSDGANAAVLVPI